MNGDFRLNANMAASISIEAGLWTVNYMHEMSLICTFRILKRRICQDVFSCVGDRQLAS